MSDDLVDILKDNGFQVVEGYSNVKKAIVDSSDKEKNNRLCSGYGVFPDGIKCKGCEDCLNTLGSE